MTRWTGAELRCAREALGVSMIELAHWLPWRQSHMSAAERGKRSVPEWVPERVMELEEIQDELVEGMIFGLENGVDFLTVHPDAASYLNAHPNELPIHASLQRSAAASAVREHYAEHGVRPLIRFFGD